MGPLVVLLVITNLSPLLLSAAGAGAATNSCSQLLAPVVIWHTTSPVVALTPAELAAAARAQLASRTRSAQAGIAICPLFVLLAVLVEAVAAGWDRHCVTVLTSGTQMSMLVSWPIFRSVFSRTSSVNSRMQLVRVAERVVAAVAVYSSVERMAPDFARRGATALTSAQWQGPQGGAGDAGLLLAADEIV
jgi:hypothetical protein